MRLAWGKRSQAQRGADDALLEMRLSFAITNEYPTELKEQYAQGRVLIGSTGSATIYALNLMGIGAEEVRIAASLKARMIAKLANDASLSPPSSIGDARLLALEMLAQCPQETREAVAYLVAHEVAGYGPISMLLEDAANIEEIVVNAPRASIGLYHARHGYCVTNLRFADEASMRTIVNRMISAAEREINDLSPVVDAQMPNGSRVHAQLPPYSTNGAVLSVRIGSGRRVDLAGLIETGAASPDALAYLWLAAEAKLNIIIAGAPASGKTSLMLALGAFLPSYERVIMVEEDVSELSAGSQLLNAVGLQGLTNSRIGARDQVINALRLRPDRLVVGEMRGSEAGEIFAGANLGVPFMTTMHTGANGAAVIARLSAKPMSVEPQLLSLLDASVFMVQSGIRQRRVESIAEYRWLGAGDCARGASAPSSLEISMPITSQGTDAEALRRSKLIERFASANLTSAAAALREFKRRSAFIAEIRGAPNGAAEHIRGYWGVR